MNLKFLHLQFTLYFCWHQSPHPHLITTAKSEPFAYHFQFLFEIHVTIGFYFSYHMPFSKG